MPKDAPKAPAEKSASVPVAKRGWAPFWALRSEIDDLFDDFYRGALIPFGRGGRDIFDKITAEMPRLDVVDKTDEVKLSAELPGMTEKDINVAVTDSSLTISGEKKEEHEEGDKDGDHYVSERRYGSFRRSIPLPKGIDQSKIKAAFKNGVLTVHLPKTPEARQPSRKIEVKAEK